MKSFILPGIVLDLLLGLNVINAGVLSTQFATSQGDSCSSLYQATATTLHQYIKVMANVNGQSEDDPDVQDDIVRTTTSLFGINIYQEGQLKKSVCKIAESDSFLDIVQKLGPMVQDMPRERYRKYYTERTHWVNTQLSDLAEYIKDLGEAKQWCSKTGYPNFPLDLTENQAFTLLNSLSEGSRSDLGLSMRSLEDTANILTASQTVEEFTNDNYFTVEDLDFYMRTLNTYGDYQKLYVDITTLVLEIKEAGILNLPFENPPKDSQCASFYKIASTVFYEYMKVGAIMGGHSVDDPEVRVEAVEATKSILGIDIFEEGEFKNLICSILDSGSFLEIVGMLGPQLQEISKSTLLNFYSNRHDFVHQYLADFAAHIDQIQEATKWVEVSGYPNFPLHMTEAQAYESVKQLSDEARQLLGLATRNLKDTAKVLAESRSLEEFVKGEWLEIADINFYMKILDTYDDLRKVYADFISLTAELKKSGLLDLPFSKTAWGLSGNEVLKNI